MNRRETFVAQTHKVYDRYWTCGWKKFDLYIKQWTASFWATNFILLYVDYVESSYMLCFIQ